MRREARIEHDAVLCEQQGLVAIASPDLKECFHNLHLATLCTAAVRIAGALRQGLVLYQIRVVTDLSQDVDTIQSLSLAVHDGCHLF